MSISGKGNAPVEGESHGVKMRPLVVLLAIAVLSGGCSAAVRPDVTSTVTTTSSTSTTSDTTTSSSKLKRKPPAYLAGGFLRVG